MRLPRLVFATLFPAAWFLCSLKALPLLWYLPLERRFVFATTVTQLGIDFFGKLLLCGAVAGLGAALTSRLKPGARWGAALAVWPLVLFALALALNVTQLVQRVPVPLPRPAQGPR